MDPMDSSKEKSTLPRLGRALGLIGFAAAAVSIVLYIAQRQSGTPRAQPTLAQGVPSLDTAPVEKTAYEQPSEAVEHAEKQRSVMGGATSSEDGAVQRIHADSTVQPLEALTVGELYKLAQRHDITGRSNMRKAQLVEALREQGLTAAES